VAASPADAVRDTKSKLRKEDEVQADLCFDATVSAAKSVSTRTDSNIGRSHSKIARVRAYYVYRMWLPVLTRLQI